MIEKLSMTSEPLCLIPTFRSVPDAYAQHLIDEGVMTQGEVEEITKKQFDYYNDELQNVDSYEPEKSYFNNQWKGFVQAPSELTIWDTGVSWDLLSYIGRKSVYHPEDFVIFFFLQK